MSMWHNHSHHREDTPDPLAEFLAPFFIDVPVLPTSTIAHASIPSSSSSAPTDTPASTSALDHPSYSYPTCQWISQTDLPIMCNAALPEDPRLVCDHFRLAHNVRGNEKVQVNCHWRHCDAAPMLRGSLIRHVLAVHLGLLRWQCELCGRMFSRKGTWHICVEGE